MWLSVGEWQRSGSLMLLLLLLRIENLRVRLGWVLLRTLELEQEAREEGRRARTVP